MKKYKKPQLVAKNKPTGSFAAGCPAKTGLGGPGGNPCSYSCEIRK